MYVRMRLIHHKIDITFHWTTNFLKKIIKEFKNIEMTSYGPTSIRDDQSHRSISTNVQKFLRSSILGDQSDDTDNRKTYRHDGRSRYELRPLKLQFDRSHAESSCTVQLGKSTRVMSNVSCDIIPPPYLDKPNDGSIQIRVDLSPMAAMGLESNESSKSNFDGANSNINVGDVSQRLMTNRLQRLLERTLIQGGAIDTEALCVQSDEWVWKLMIDVTVLDYGGNILDACALSTIAALRHFRLPCTTRTENDNSESKGITVIHSDEREATPLPLHHTPVLVSFALFTNGQKDSDTIAIADPDDREELIADCPNVTYAFNKYSELCCMDFPGGCELNPMQLMDFAKLAEKKAIQMLDILEDSLSKSDEQAKIHRMERIARANFNLKTIPHHDVPEGIPYHESSHSLPSHVMEMDQQNILQNAKEEGKQIAHQSEQEEKYRLRALDYAIGHVAAKVKEDIQSQKQPQTNSSSSGLLQAMLKSANTAPPNLSIATDTKIPSTGYPPNFAAIHNAYSSSHTKDADDEFDEFVKNNSNAQKTNGTHESKTIPKHNVNMDDSDDDEEVTMLVGEFSSKSTSKAASTNDQASKTNKVNNINDDDGNDDELMVDLSAAVRKKKTNKKQRKKNK